MAIVRYFDFTFVIENPYSSLLRHRPYMAGVPYHRVDYCAYQPPLGMKKSNVLFTNLRLHTADVPRAWSVPGHGRHAPLEHGHRDPLPVEVKKTTQ